MAMIDCIQSLYFMFLCLIFSSALTEAKDNDSSVVVVVVDKKKLIYQSYRINLYVYHDELIVSTLQNKRERKHLPSYFLYCISFLHLHTKVMNHYFFILDFFFLPSSCNVRLTMAQNTRISSAVSQSDGTTRPAKTPEPFHPHYFTTFQNFSCGPKAISTEPPQNKALLPIPTKFKDECEDLLNVINPFLIEDITKIAEYTSVIPNIFFDQYDNFHSLRYLIDRIMLRIMTEANIINWIPALKKLYPIRTSGKDELKKI
jgi:hypothetical protein